MSSAIKTLELLSYFSATQPEIGLTEFRKLAGRDKATTYRHLQALEETGFIEQNPTNKRYRLGPAVLHLAQLREQTVPRKQSAEVALEQLAQITGETAHVSVLSGTTVYPLVSCQSTKHGIRATIDLKTFPLHATASGICALAFGPAELITVATRNLAKFTTATVRTSDALEQMIAQARATGFAYSNGSYEDEIYSISSPIFAQTGAYAGAVSVACVASRITPELEHCVRQNLAKASAQITQNWGGILPTIVTAAWAAHQPQL